MSRAQPLVMMMAGGTGGHVYPALAVALELIERGYAVEWIGTSRGLEHRVVPGANIPLHLLPVRGLRGKGIVDSLRAMVALVASVVMALWLVARRAPHCVVGMGGYVAAPAGLAAWLLRKPLLIHEQNAVAGTTNRLLAPLARTVIAGFPGAFKSERSVSVLGNPVRAELLRARAQRAQNDDSVDAQVTFSSDQPLRLLVLGGSLGAQAINSVLPEAVRCMNAQRSPLTVWHQAGVAHSDSVRAAYRQALGEACIGDEAQVRVAPFIDDMRAAYDWADIVLCRAGALTIAELAIMGCPALLVPLPWAIDDHQRANAQWLAATGGATLIPQNELDVAGLVTQLQTFIDDPAQLSRMAAASYDAGLPEATAQVCDLCEEVLHV